MPNGKKEQQGITVKYIILLLLFIGCSESPSPNKTQDEAVVIDFSNLGKCFQYKYLFKRKIKVYRILLLGDYVGYQIEDYVCNVDRTNCRFTRGNIYHDLSDFKQIKCPKELL